jgi:Mce-associated membrane protein
MTVTDERPRSDESPPPPGTGPSRLGRVLPVASVVAAVLALVFGALWLIALNSDSVSVASDRDAVLRDARQAVLNLNTLDYHNAPAGLDLWIQSSTGSVRDEFQKNRDAYAQLVTQQKRTTTATIADAAVGELDDRTGVARVLIGVDVTVTPEGQQPTVTRQRIEAEMTRTDEGWKVSALDPLLTPGNGQS